MKVVVLRRSTEGCEHRWREMGKNDGGWLKQKRKCGIGVVDFLEGTVLELSGCNYALIGEANYEVPFVAF